MGRGIPIPSYPRVQQAPLSSRLLPPPAIIPGNPNTPFTFTGLYTVPPFWSNATVPITMAYATLTFPQECNAIEVDNISSGFIGNDGQNNVVSGFLAPDIWGLDLGREPFMVSQTGLLPQERNFNYYQTGGTSKFQAYVLLTNPANGATGNYPIQLSHTAPQGAFMFNLKGILFRTIRLGCQFAEILSSRQFVPGYRVRAWYDPELIIGRSG